jgi:carboxymethylenebutenolidase
MPAESVTIPSGASTIGGYLALPDGAGPHPAVVVIHEAFGLTDNIREIARRFADQGYAALAVDLFSGRNRVLCMARLMTAMLRVAPDRFGIRDLSAALGYLSTVPTIDAARLGAIGFCLGGGLAIAWACTDDRLQAIAPFYGTNPRPFKAVARLCPVVGSYPGRDFTAASGRRLDEALDGYGIPRDIKIYPAARHSFFNQAGRAYQPDAAADSWQRVMAFFDSHVRNPGSVPHGRAR